MKKFLALTIAVVMVLSLLTACGAQPTSTTTNTPAESTASAGTETPSYTIKLGHSNPEDPNNIVHYTSLYFKKKLEEYSNGAITDVIYPSNQLGDDQDQMRLSVICMAAWA